MTTFTEFDPSKYLDNEETIALYLSEALDDPNPDVFIAALGDIAKARGMTQIAKDAGVGRESLYKAFLPGAKLRYETVRKVMQGLGVRMTVAPNG